jgi:hypothetical protein
VGRQKIITGVFCSKIAWINEAHLRSLVMMHLHTFFNRNKRGIEQIMLLIFVRRHFLFFILVFGKHGWLNSEQHCT